MAFDKLIRAGIDAYKAGPKKASPPAKPLQKAPPPPKVRSQAKASAIADMLNVPGRNAARNAATRTEREMKKRGL